MVPAKAKCDWQTGRWIDKVLPGTTKSMAWTILEINGNKTKYKSMTLTPLYIYEHMWIQVLGNIKQYMLHLGLMSAELVPCITNADSIPFVSASIMTSLLYMIHIFLPTLCKDNLRFNVWFHKLIQQYWQMISTVDKCKIYSRSWNLWCIVHYTLFLLLENLCS